MNNLTTSPRHDRTSTGYVLSRHDRLSRRRVLLRRWCLLLVISTMPDLSVAETIEWAKLSDGLTVSVWKPGESCPTVPALLAVDIDPERARFSIHSYEQEGLAHPLTIEEWQKRTGHQVVFNAGLFRENFSYLGLLYKEGRSVGSRRHTSWQGLFVAEPVASGVKKARILDLALDHFDEERPPYREAAQALMLLDQTGKIRVRDTGKYAYQTIVADTDNGHILILKSLGVVPLYDIGQCMKDTLPAVHRAMAMDGGSSSDIRVLESLWKHDAQADDHVSWKVLFAGSTSHHIPLPTVIGVSPR